MDGTLREMIRMVGKNLKSFGREVALDSTDVAAFGKYRKDKRNADPDAKWGSRTSKDPQTKRQLFYGYKLHLACDARYGVPLAYTVMAANANDSPQLPVLFNQIRDDHSELKPKFAIADKGYDHSPNYRYLHQRKISAVIAIRDTEKSDQTYSLEGRPRCTGGLDMDFLGTDREKGHTFSVVPKVAAILRTPSNLRDIAISNSMSRSMICPSCEKLESWPGRIRRGSGSTTSVALSSGCLDQPSNPGCWIRTVASGFSGCGCT